MLLDIIDVIGRVYLGIGAVAALCIIGVTIYAWLSTPPACASVARRELALCVWLCVAVALVWPMALVYFIIYIRGGD